MVSFFGRLLQSFLKQTVFFPAQVYAGWKIILNFVNMFFILLLIIMAFGIILDLPKYRIRFIDFLIPALLINFSYAIGVYVVQLGDSIAQVFLNIIGDISTTFGQGLSLQAITNFGTNFNAGNTAAQAAAAANATAAGTTIGGNVSASIMNLLGLYNATTGPGGGDITALLITAVIFIVFMVIVALAFLALAIFAIVRIPFIWFLLIVSPLAWFSYALPSLKDMGWKSWWKQFIGWSFFMPVYLFFMTFATAFINAKTQLAGAMSPATLAPTGLVGGIFSILPLTDIFMFVVSIIFIVGGLGLALKMSFLTGTKAGEMFGKVDAGVKKYFPGSRRLRGAYASRKEGLQAKVEDLKERGVPIGFGKRIGSEREARLREAGVAEKYSLGAMKGAKEQQLTKEVGGYKERIKTKNDSELAVLINKGSLTEKLAARELLRERSRLDLAEIKKTYSMYRESGANSAASKFVTSIELEKLNSEDRKGINKFVDPTDTETRRKLARAMAEKGDFRDDKAGLLTAASLFATESDKTDIISKARKYNLKDAAEVMAELKLVRDPATGKPYEKNDDAVNKYLGDSIARAKIEDMLEFSFTEGLLNDPKIKTELTNKFSNPEFSKKFMERASGVQIEALKKAQIITEGNQNTGNVIDLRNKIVLPPGAQFEIDRERSREKPSAPPPHVNNPSNSAAQEQQQEEYGRDRRREEEQRQEEEYNRNKAGGFNVQDKRTDNNDNK